jgi:hypothetical protein
MVMLRQSPYRKGSTAAQIVLLTHNRRAIVSVSYSSDKKSRIIRRHSSGSGGRGIVRKVGREKEERCSEEIFVAVI